MAEHNIPAEPEIPKELSLPHFREFIKICQSFIIRNFRIAGPYQSSQYPYRYSAFPGIWSLEAECLKNRKLALGIETALPKVLAKGRTRLEHITHYDKLLEDFYSQVKTLKDKDDGQIARIRNTIDIHSSAIWLEYYSHSCTHYKQPKKQLARLVGALKEKGDAGDEPIIGILNPILQISSETKKTDPICGYPGLQRIAPFVLRLKRDEVGIVNEVLNSNEMPRKGDYNGLVEAFYTLLSKKVLGEGFVNRIEGKKLQNVAENNNWTLNKLKAKGYSPAFTNMYFLLKGHQKAHSGYLFFKGAEWGSAMLQFYISTIAYGEIHRQEEAELALRAMKKTSQRGGYAWRKDLIYENRRDILNKLGFEPTHFNHSTSHMRTARA